MGFNPASVDWIFVGLMMALAFVTALLGSLIAFRNRFLGAILAAILFGVGFVAWNYYPHDFKLPILKTTGPDTPAPAATTAPTPPANPAAAPPATMAPPAPTAPAGPPPGSTR